jgi:hypothetical protein
MAAHSWPLAKLAGLGAAAGAAAAAAADAPSLPASACCCFCSRGASSCPAAALALALLRPKAGSGRASSSSSSACGPGPWATTCSSGGSGAPPFARLRDLWPAGPRKQRGLPCAECSSAQEHRCCAEAARCRQAHSYWLPGRPELCRGASQGDAGSRGRPPTCRRPRRPRPAPAQGRPPAAPPLPLPKPARRPAAPPPPGSSSASRPSG